MRRFLILRRYIFFVGLPPKCQPPWGHEHSLQNFERKRSEHLGVESPQIKNQRAVFFLNDWVIQTGHVPLSNGHPVYDVKQNSLHFTAFIIS